MNLMRVNKCIYYTYNFRQIYDYYSGIQRLVYMLFNTYLVCVIKEKVKNYRIMSYEITME